MRTTSRPPIFEIDETRPDETHIIMSINTDMPPRCWICGRSEAELKSISPPAEFVGDLIDHQALSLPPPYRLCNVCRWVICNVINSEHFGLAAWTDPIINRIEEMEAQLQRLELRAGGA